MKQHTVFAETLTFRVSGRVWIEGPRERFLGIGRYELLQHIHATGSISQAAKAMQMSYKRAWDLVTSMNAQSNSPLVATQTGGTHGGGARLTPQGEEALALFNGLQQRFEQFLAEETQRLSR
jgi:molybdate transport system regulatory protein